MYLKTLLIIDLALFAAIASQAVFYMIAMTHVQKQMPASVYIQTRQLINSTITGRLRLIYYAALALTLVLLKLTFSYYTGLLFFAVLISGITLVADIIIALKGNQPINAVFNNATLNNIPSNWELMRDKWNRVFSYRQILAIAGALALLLGLVFEN